MNVSSSRTLIYQNYIYYVKPLAAVIRFFGVILQQQLHHCLVMWCSR